MALGAAKAPRTAPGGAPFLILGSASPRRLGLLAQVGIVPDAVIPAEIDETPRRSEAPRAHALRLALDKSARVAAACGAGTGPGRPIVLAADTVVAVGRRILGKPRDGDEAVATLRLLSGRRHRVITAVVVRAPDRAAQRAVETIVRFKRLAEAEILGYRDSGEWQGKAGAYAIQGRAAAFVPWIGGSYSNVVGLPLTETVNLLRGMGYRALGAVPEAASQ